MIIDCEQVREEIVEFKKQKVHFDSLFVGEAKNWNMRTMRSIKKHHLELRLDFLRSEARLVVDYKFVVRAVMASIGEPKDFEGASKIVEVESRVREGEKIKVITVKDILNLKRVENLDEKIPENMTVMDNMFLQGSDITELPKGLVVGGSLHINSTKIKKLPDDLIVHRDIHIDPSLTDEVARIKEHIHGSVYVGTEV